MSEQQFSLIKPIPDQNEYKIIKLDNNLKVLLISDFEAQICMSAIDVAVGSWSQSPSWPGLAHFLEHALFLNKKDPNGEDFQVYLSKNGGLTNAYTSHKNTNYYYKVQCNSFEESLNQFADLFIDPQFIKEKVEKEISAVNGEYEMFLQKDNNKILLVMSQLAEQTHPLFHFSVGSYQTLKKDGFDQALKEFYQNYYSPNIMAAAIYGNQKIEELEQLVINSKLKNIINNEYKKPDLNIFGKPFKDSLGRVIKLQTDMNVRNLKLVYQIDSTKQYNLTKPLNHIISLLNYNGRGSFLKIMQDQQMIYNCNQFTFYETETYLIFIVTMDLTQKGFRNIGYVINSFISFLQKLKSEFINPSLYYQQQQLYNYKFKYLETSGISEDTLSDYAQIFNDLDESEWKNLLKQNYIYDQFNSSQINLFLDQLQDPNNFFVVVGTNYKGLFNEILQNYSNESSIDFANQYIDFLYSPFFDNDNITFNLQWSMSQQFSDDAITYLTTNNQDRFVQMYLIKLNEFVPEDIQLFSQCNTTFNNSQTKEQIYNQEDYISIKSDAALLQIQVDKINKQQTLIPDQSLNNTIDPFMQDNRQTQFNYEEFVPDQQSIEQCLINETQYEETHKYPQLMKEDINGKVWFYFDRNLQIPKAGVIFQIKSQITQKNVEDLAKLLLLKRIINYEIEEQMRNALEAGFIIDVLQNKNVFEVFLYGWNNNVQVVLMQLIELIKQIKIRQTNFNFAKASLNGKLHSYDHIPSHSKGIGVWLRQLLEQDFISPYDMMSIVSQLTPDHIKEFQEKYFENYQYDIFVFGNILPTATDSIVNQIQQGFGVSKTIIDDKIFQKQVTKLIGNSYIFTEWVNDEKSSKLSATINYYQHGMKSLDSYVKSGLIRNFLKATVFNYCRTQKELGYIAQAEIVAHGCIDGFLIYVAGPKEQPPGMDKAIEESLDMFAHILETLSDEEFNDMKQSLQNHLKQKFQKLREKATYYWRFIATSSYIFDQRELALQYIETIQKKDLHSFFLDIFQINKGKISVQLFNRQQSDQMTSSNISNFLYSDNNYQCNSIFTTFS